MSESAQSPAHSADLKRERQRRKHNRTQIESAREGDRVIFNDRARPAVVESVSEMDDGKRLILDGRRTGQYRLDFDRETDLIQFTRVSHNAREDIRIHQFTVVNRPVRPFDRVSLADRDVIPAVEAIDSAPLAAAISAYRSRYCTDGAVTGDTETYRDLTVLEFQLDEAHTYDLVGPEIDLCRPAIIWACKNPDDVAVPPSVLRDLRMELADPTMVPATPSTTAVDDTA